MASEHAENLLIDIKTLSRRVGLSIATLHRLKNAGKLPYYQPGGKGTSLLFPPDAIERACTPPIDEASDPTQDKQQRLPGPLPAWQRPNSY